MEGKSDAVYPVLGVMPQYNTQTMEDGGEGSNANRLLEQGASSLDADDLSRAPTVAATQGKTEEKAASYIQNRL